MYPRDIPASREITGNHHTAYILGDKSRIRSIILSADVCNKYSGGSFEYHSCRSSEKTYKKVHMVITE